MTHRFLFAMLCLVNVAGCGGGSANNSTDDLAPVKGPALDMVVVAAQDESVVHDLSAINSDLSNPVDAAISDTFSGSVKPVLVAECFSCHMAANWNAIESLTASSDIINYLTITKSTECPSLPYVTAGSADDSYLYQKLAGAGSCFTGSQMPKGETPLSASALAAVQSWINSGATNN
jgi:hypothetical protein